MQLTRRNTFGIAAAALALSNEASKALEVHAPVVTPVPTSPSGPVPQIAGSITSFNIVNATKSVSKCRFRRALWFAKGDIPNGYVPVIRQGNSIVLAQFDERTTWSDGSLKLCVMSMMDTDFAGSETRTYGVSRTTGSYNNTGPRTLSDVTRAHAFKVTFANVTQYDGSTTVRRGSGAFTADFNTMARTATRIFNYHSGPVCSSWEVWGMATDNAGGAADAHLKTVWYVTAWNNPNGSLNDVEYGAVVSQDWWSVAGKFRLNYDATLLDGTAAINAYTGTQHPYHAQWMTVRTANDDNHARRFWSTAIPTLYHVFDKNYARSTGLFPYLDPTFIPNSNSSLGYTSSYKPLSSQNHRAGIDQTGGYMGRGLMPNSDCVAWMRQTSTDYRLARTNAFAGLHVPYHYRSNARRTIVTGPQSGTDTANTVISLIMRPLSPAAYDFTVHGMPAPIDAYVQPCELPIASTYVAKSGGDGVWTAGTETSHAVAYSYGMYLLEGERHFLQATLDLATNACHQLRGNKYGGTPQASYCGVAPFQALLSIPGTQYSGIANARPEEGNLRNAGWGMMVVAQAAAICPDADVQNGFIKLFCSQQSAYTIFNMAYMDSTQLALGIYGSVPGGGAGYVNSPWMSNFQVMAYAFNAIANEDKNSRAAINNCLQYAALAPWESGSTPYRSSSYRELASLRTQTPFDRKTNPYLTRGAMLLQTNVTVTSNVITPSSGIPLSANNSDIIYFVRTNDGMSPVQIPAGLVEAKPYYAVNCTSLTLQVSATRGGTPLAIPNGAYSIGFQPSAWSRAPAAKTPYMPNADDYPPISAAALIMASKAGATAITPAMISSAQAFLAPVNYATYVTWKLAP